MTINLKDTVDARDVLIPLTLPDMIEAVREDLELTKVDMANKLGVSKAHYGNLVNGRESVSIKRAGEWAKLLGYPEMLFVQYAIQDQLRRNDYSFSVRLEA